jgi:hypothetical protein
LPPSPCRLTLLSRQPTGATRGAASLDQPRHRAFQANGRAVAGRCYSANGEPVKRKADAWSWCLRCPLGPSSVESQGSRGASERRRAVAATGECAPGIPGRVGQAPSRRSRASAHERSRDPPPTGLTSRLEAGRGAGFRQRAVGEWQGGAAESPGIWPSTRCASDRVDRILAATASTRAIQCSTNTTSAEIVSTPVVLPTAALPIAAATYP